MRAIRSLSVAIVIAVSIQLRVSGPGALRPGHREKCPVPRCRRRPLWGPACTRVHLLSEVYYTHTALEKPNSRRKGAHITLFFSSNQGERLNRDLNWSKMQGSCNPEPLGPALSQASPKIRQQVDLLLQQKEWDTGAHANLGDGQRAHDDRLRPAPAEAAGQLLAIPVGAGKRRRTRRNVRLQAGSKS